MRIHGKTGYTNLISDVLMKEFAFRISDIWWSANFLPLTTNWRQCLLQITSTSMSELLWWIYTYPNMWKFDHNLDYLIFRNILPLDINLRSGLVASYLFSQKKHLLSFLFHICIHILADSWDGKRKLKILKGTQLMR